MDPLLPILSLIAVAVLIWVAGEWVEHMRAERRRWEREDRDG